MTVKNINFLVNTVPCQNQPLKLRVKCDASRHFVGRYYSSKSKDFEKAFREERDSAKALFLDRNDDFIDFKARLEEMMDVEVILVDERLSTVVAENSLIFADVSRKKRKEVIDKMAAVQILQGYLDGLKK